MYWYSTLNDSDGMEILSSVTPFANYNKPSYNHYISSTLITNVSNYASRYEATDSNQQTPMQYLTI